MNNKWIFAMRASLCFRLALTMLFFCGASIASAQSQRVQDSLALVRKAADEQRCRDQEPRLTRSTSLDSASMIAFNMARCPDSGPAALARYWRETSGDSVFITSLVLATNRIRDMRVFQAVSSVAGDRSRPRAVRLGALSVMWFYADRAFPVFGSDLLTADPPSAITGVGYEPQPAIDGRDHLPPNIRQLVAQRAQALAAVAAEDKFMAMVFKETAERYNKPPR